jgi:hypothetical protein
MLRIRDGAGIGSAAPTGSILIDLLLEERRERELRKQVASPPQ